MGKKLGNAPVEGRMADVARDLLPLMELLSLDSWKRLGDWAVALAEAEGIIPATDVRPEIEEAILADFMFKNESFAAKLLTKHEQRERKAEEYYGLQKTIGQFERLREGAIAKGKTEILEITERKLQELKDPAVQEQWDQWFEWYHQVQCSLDGQRRAKLSPSEREAEDLRIAEAHKAMAKDE
jgi:hypothetical protein